jgi:hypothetical protein
VVLARALLGLLLVAGCKQSLFDNKGDVDAGDTNTDIPSSCPATCIADAAADFGTTRWRFVDDMRNRMWTPMAMMGNAYVGGGMNRVSLCKNESSPACDALPGALVVTTSGMAGPDPALSFTAPASQVVQLTIRIRFEDGAPAHDVRLYRNAREDSLFTAQASGGATFERALTLDAIAGDRFYLALSTAQAGSFRAAVHFYANSTMDMFPIECVLALPFAGSMATTTDNACGADYAYKNDTADAMWSFGVPAFPELGNAADITMDRYFQGADVLPRAGDTTTQLWLRHDAFISSYNAIVFSDIDLDYTGGLAIYITNTTPPKLGAETCTVVTPQLGFAYADAPFPNDHAWHFVRVVHTNGMVKICVDGTRTSSYVLATGKMQAMYAPWIARNQNWLPQGAFFDGAVDDVRVIKAALPCD